MVYTSIDSQYTVIAALLMNTFSSSSALTWVLYNIMLLFLQRLNSHSKHAYPGYKITITDAILATTYLVKTTKVTAKCINWQRQQLVWKPTWLD